MRDEQERQEDEMSKRAPMLAEKTLLIRVEWLDKELNEAMIEIYPFKYKICDRELMDEVAMKLDGNYAYGVVLPYVISGSRSNSVMYFQFVMDGADSQAMCVVRPSTGSMMLAGGLTGKAGNRNFTIKVMEKIMEQVKAKRG